MKRFLFTLRALRYKNFRLFFLGQAISLTGTWMTGTANSWLVYRLTGSAYLLGVVGFATQFPAFLLAPIAGVYVDRWDKRRLLLICQVFAMLQSFALAIMVLTHSVSYSAVIFLCLIQGFVNAFEIPCRQSFVVDMIDDKEALGNAIALKSSMFNAARMIGPSIAGVIIAVSNEGWCYLIDGVSYIAVIAALAAITVRKKAAPSGKAPSAVAQMREGWSYAYRSVPIRSIVILIGLVSLVGVPYSVLIPVFAQKILGGGADTLGFLMASSGGGAMLGALWLAAREKKTGLGRLVPLGAAMFGAGLAAFALSRWRGFSMACLVLTGAGFMVQMASSNTLLQTIVDDDKRGRVMSLFIMAFLGTAPVGALCAGAIGDRIGAPATLLMGAAACLAGAAWFAWMLKYSLSSETALK